MHLDVTSHASSHPSPSSSKSNRISSGIASVGWVSFIWTATLVGNSDHFNSAPCFLSLNLKIMSCNFKIRGYQIATSWLAWQTRNWKSHKSSFCISPSLLIIIRLLTLIVWENRTQKISLHLKLSITFSTFFKFKVKWSSETPNHKNLERRC